MAISFLAAFQPLINMITPHLLDAFDVLIAITILVCLVGLSDNLSSLILKIVRGPDHRAGWSDAKTKSYEKYKERSDFRRELARESRGGFFKNTSSSGSEYERETRDAIAREKRRWE
jgi:hypothetical protein